MSSKDTKSRILDQAERLFAEHGFRNTSLRTLTERAKVNLAAVNYHFNSKEGLLQAVLARRLQPLNQRRQQRIDQVLAEAHLKQEKPSVLDLVSAFVIPTLEFGASSRGAGHFLRLIGRTWNEPDEKVRSAVFEQIGPLISNFAAALGMALPQLPENILRLRLMFLLSSLGYIMSSGNSSPLLQDTGTEHPDQQLTTREFMKFILAGLEAPL